VSEKNKNVGQIKNAQVLVYSIGKLVTICHACTNCIPLPQQVG